MDIDRKQILVSCLETIKDISDKEYQKRVWIRGEGPEVDDFDEAVCDFFGDGDPIIENYKDFDGIPLLIAPIILLIDQMRPYNA